MCDPLLDGVFFLAYTQTDIDNARAAINTIITRGAAEVEINGRKVKFLSLEMLQAQIKIMENELLQQTYGASVPVSFIPDDS